MLVICKHRQMVKVANVEQNSTTLPIKVFCLPNLDLHFMVSNLDLTKLRQISNLSWQIFDSLLEAVGMETLNCYAKATSSACTKLLSAAHTGRENNLGILQLPMSNKVVSTVAQLIMPLRLEKKAMRWCYIKPSYNSTAEYCVLSSIQ